MISFIGTTQIVSAVVHRWMNDKTVSLSKMNGLFAQIQQVPELGVEK